MPYLEPVAMLGALAMVTTKARIGCSVFILGHRHPVAMAKMLATIDVLSGGRLIVGVGVGWWRQELEMLGVDFARRGRAADEALRVFKAMWTEREPRFEGEVLPHRRRRGRAQAAAEAAPADLGRRRLAGRAASRDRAGRRLARDVQGPAQLREGLGRLGKAADQYGRDMKTIEISVRYSLPDTMIAAGPQQAIDELVG